MNEPTHTAKPTVRRHEVDYWTLRLWEALNPYPCSNEEAWHLIGGYLDHAYERGRMDQRLSGFTPDERAELLAERPIECDGSCPDCRAEDEGFCTASSSR
jgi:hypothetical protein